MSYDTPSPREEQSGDLDEKLTDDGVPTDDALPETRPTDPNPTVSDPSDPRTTDPHDPSEEDAQ
jgi:hypothetical protein